MDKVNAVRTGNAHVPKLTFTCLTSGTQLTEFTLLNMVDVVCAIRRLPEKNCAADLIPVSVMKVIGAEVAPFFT